MFQRVPVSPEQNPSTSQDQEQDLNAQREESQLHRAQDPSAPRAGPQGSISVLKAGFEFLTIPVSLGQDPSALGSISASPARTFGRGWPCWCTCDPESLACTEMDHQCLGALRDLGIPPCPSWQLHKQLLACHDNPTLSVPFPPTDDSGDESVSQTDKTELQNTLRILSSKVEDLSTCNDLIAKHGTALQRSLSELEALRLPPDSTDKIKQVNERATLFRITSNAMINVSPRPESSTVGKAPTPVLSTVSPTGLPGFHAPGANAREEVAEVAAAGAGSADSAGGDAGAAGQAAQPPGKGFPGGHGAPRQHGRHGRLWQRWGGTSAVPKGLLGFSKPGSASLTLLIPRDVSFPSHLCSQVVLASSTGSNMLDLLVLVGSGIQQLAPLSFIRRPSELGWGVTPSPC